MFEVSPEPRWSGTVSLCRHIGTGVKQRTVLGRWWRIGNDYGCCAPVFDSGGGFDHLMGKVWKLWTISSLLCVIYPLSFCDFIFASYTPVQLFHTSILRSTLFAAGCVWFTEI